MPNEDPYSEEWLLIITPTKLGAELKEIMDFNTAASDIKSSQKENEQRMQPAHAYTTFN